MIDSLATIFGVCIALVAAVLGLAFPMFVERINGIVDKYGSPNISKKFKNEASYICFNVLMVVCIIELFVFPIIMMAVGTKSCNLLLISIQGISVFTLCMVIIRVYFLVMTYSGPHSFLNRIKTNDTDEKKLLSSLQILIEYGSRNDVYADIYREAMDMLVERIFKFQKEHVDMDKKSQADKITDNQEINVNKDVCDDESTEQIIVEYPEHIFDTLKQLYISSVKPGNAILNRQPNVVDALFNTYCGFSITDKIYGLMWLWINGMVGAKHDTWMKRYWVIATQSFISKFGLDGIPIIVNSKREEKIFFEFHLMVGVLLFYQKRYDVLHYAFTLTNFLPPKYPLIPNTFRQIFDWYEEFPWSDDPSYILKYNMIGDYEGAKTDLKIKDLLIDYIALLMVRLFSVNDFNITYSDPMGLPSVGSTIKDNKDKIERITEIIDCLKTIPNEAIEALGLEPDWKQDAKELLERYMDKCQEKKQNLLIERFVSEGRTEEVKQSLMGALTKYNPSLPSSEEKSKGDEDEIFLADLEEKITDEMILNHSYQWPYLGESLIQGMLIQLIEFYCHKLVETAAIKTYSIAYRDFGEAMRQLHLTPDYAIVALAVSKNTMAEIKEFNMDADGITYQGNGEKGLVNVYNIPSCTDSMVLIMRETDVPRFRYRDLEEDEYVPDGLSDIETERHLYSNIDNITEADFILKVKQGFYVHILETLKYVCIRIQSHLESNTMDVSNVEPIKNLIK